MMNERVKELGIQVVEQSRPVWKYHDYFTQFWKEFPVTFLVCQKNTKHLIQLCIESLQRFYPDVNILVVDDESNDDSVHYLRYKELTCPNLSVWWRTGGYIGHGTQLHQAVTEKITTKYVFIMDSDVIVERGGFLEEMMFRYSQNTNLYAIGAVQISSYSNNGGEPFDEDDITLYANPQFSMIDRERYPELQPFLTDGTPLILNMKSARDKTLDVEYYPVERFSSHNSGSSWTEPRTVWMDDHDVKVRPFLTIIARADQTIFNPQTDNDFDVVIAPQNKYTGKHIFTDGSPAFDVNSNIFPIRFNVHGEYVLDITKIENFSIPDTFIELLKIRVNENNVPNEVYLYDLKCVKRQYWQQTIR